MGTLAGNGLIAISTYLLLVSPTSLFNFKALVMKLQCAKYVEIKPCKPLHEC